MLHRNLCFKQYYDNFITFEDPIVEKLCLDKWDANHDGKLSKLEAAQVNAISTTFTGSVIKSFKELRYFTSLKNEVKLKPFNEKGAFQSATFDTIILPEGLEFVPVAMFRQSKGNIVILPSTIKGISETSFNGAKLNNLILKSTEYISIVRYWGLLYARIDNLYVANYLVDTYKQSTIWNSQKIQGYLGNILPLSEYNGEI